MKKYGAVTENGDCLTCLKRLFQISCKIHSAFWEWNGIFDGDTII